MPASITGKVFDDVNHNGAYDIGEPGIANVYVVAQDPNGTCTSVQTDVNGDYLFSNLTVAGTYIIYETVVDPGVDCPPTTFTQPAGFANSTTLRTVTVNVTSNDISNDVIVQGPNFGHDNANPIPCTTSGFQIVGPDLYTQNLFTGERELVCNIGFGTNSLAYNEQDGYLYATINFTTKVLRISENCDLTEIGPIPNLPGGAINYNVGTMDSAGYMYITSTTLGRYYTIDFTDSNSPTWGQLVDPTASFAPTTSGVSYTGVSSIVAADWAYNEVDGFIYALRSNNGNLRRLDPLTGVVTDIPTTGTSSSGAYGASYADGEGNLYFINNTTGRVYIVTTSGVGARYAQASPATQNDGASCASAIFEIDYGDAPDTNPGSQGPGNYRTLLASNGPRHQIGLNNLFLGTQVTAESDAYQSSDALGDDQTQGIQDDAYTPPLPKLQVGDTSYSIDIEVTNETGQDANLYAWLDFNANGRFQTNESFSTIVPSQAGTQTVTLNFTTTETLVPGDTFLRIRVTTSELINTGGATAEDTRSYGPAADGEVEDYLVVIARNPELTLVKSADVDFADIGDTVTYTIVVENVGAADALNINFVDPIPIGTSFVAGSLTVDGTPTAGDLNVGIPLTDLIPGGSHTIEFQVTVDEIPTPNPTENIATTDYENLAGEPFSGDSNTISTQVNHAELIGDNGDNFVKSVDQTEVGIGDTITYSFSIDNTGNVAANNVVLTDPIPSQSTLVAGSLLVNGSPSGDDPNTGINIPSIAPGGNATVEFQITINSVPDPNPILDTGSISYGYLVDPAGAPVSAGGDSNTVSTLVRYADLLGDNGENFVKRVSPEYADIGEILTYDFNIENTGTVPATDIVLTDTIPNGTTLIPNSVLVNGGATGEDPEAGISIPDIGGGDVATVSFQVSVDEIPDPNPIPNTGSIAYEFIGSPNEPPVTDAGDSNTVASQVRNADLLGENGENFVKSVDLTEAGLGYILTYSFSIKNTGNVAANNVILTDPIPSGASYVEDSLLVNGNPSPDDPNTGISIASILSGTTTTVSFQVTVDEVPESGLVLDTARLNYRYTVDPNQPPVEATGESNTVSTEVKYADLLGENGENFVKSVDPEYGDLGEILTYSFSIENTGNVPAIDIVLTDIIPSETTLIADSVLVNGVLSADDPGEGISIPDINAGESATVSFQVKVDELPEVNPIEDTGSLQYGYIVDPLRDPIRNGGDSNTVSTQVNHADLLGENGENFVKSSRPEFVDVGYTITYSFTIENTGNAPAENVVLTDPIPNGTSYVEGSLLVNGIATGDNPELGINIPSIGAGEKATISFEVLVEEIPDPNPIPNTGSIAYTYRLNPLEAPVEAGGDSNTVTNQLNRADLLGENGENFVKSVDPEVAELGDEVTYSYAIENTGNIPAIDVVLVDPLPSEVSFVEGSTLVNGLSSADSPITGISLPDILAGESATVSFRVSIDEMPDPNPMINIGSIDYGYIVNPGEEPVVAGGNSNEVQLQVELVYVQMLKSVDNPTAQAGEELTFSIMVSNEGTVTAQNIVFTDEIPEGTTFVENSLLVDGEVREGANPGEGIDLGNIAADDFATVTFTVIIDDPATTNPIENQGSIDYQVQLSPDGEIEERSAESNEIEINIESAELTMVKSSDKESAKIGEVITYTVVVINTGTVMAENVMITDQLVEGINFVENSVRVDGEELVGADLNVGINIGNIDVGAEVVVSFEVEIEDSPCPSEFTNQVLAEFEFHLEGRGETFTGSAESNGVSVDINIKIFKQLSIDEKLEIPPQKPDAEDILDVEAIVEITSTTIIKTLAGKSYEGQTLTGYKLIIEGVLKQLITYIADTAEQDVHGAHFEFPFSTFLVLPANFNPNRELNVTAVIEDVAAQLLDERTIAKHVNLLVRVGEK